MVSLRQAELRLWPDWLLSFSAHRRAARWQKRDPRSAAIPAGRDQAFVGGGSEPRPAGSGLGLLWRYDFYTRIPKIEICDNF